MSNRTYTCDKTGCFACYELNRLIEVIPYKKTNWTDWEITFLEENYKVMKTENLSEILNRSPSSIWQKIYGLNKKAA